jgi:hypothetical protein
MLLTVSLLVVLPFLSLSSDFAHALLRALFRSVAKTPPSALVIYAPARYY